LANRGDPGGQSTGTVSHTEEQRSGPAETLAKAVAFVGPLTWQSFDPATFELTSRKADPSRWGDVVLVRKDTPTSYHLSVIVDDAIQGVTHIVRGMDLEASTDIHVLLQALLGLPQPLYWHHGLITGPDGKKLAKSRSSDSLAVSMSCPSKRMRPP
jgi:glutamyl/glutaminyl-tRNA synthetase